jgi:multimeric flavodoxin WrbA
MEQLMIIRPACREKRKEKRLTAIVEGSTAGLSREIINTIEELEQVDLTNKKILFAISLGESGINLELYAMLKKIRTSQDMFAGSVGGIIVDGDSEFYTKSIAREVVFSANLQGCTFVGRPLVEGTGSLENYNIIARNLATDHFHAYLESGNQLVRRIMEYRHIKKEHANLLVLHASNIEHSNSLLLWSLVRKQLLEAWGAGLEIEEISLLNGEVYDCVGCPYETCLHFGEKHKCIYGGVIVDRVYPGILKCDGLLLLCPNYNDAIGANLTAFVNRLTALFRSNDFSDKRIFSIIISGYSGGDILAQQLISGINMNKAFVLPPRFALIETANNPKSVLRIPGIEEHARDFANRIIQYI